MKRGASTLIFTLSASLASLPGVPGSVVTGPSSFTPSSALWTYTTPSHFSVYGALAGQPIYREEIRGTALRPDRVILALIPPGHAGLHLVCLDRRDGTEVWRRYLPGEVIPMSREFPTTENALFLALYHSPKRSVTVAAIDLANGRHIWERDASATPGRYQYGDLLDVDTANGTLDLYLPEASRNNRVSISMDGARTRQFSYRGYFWSTGARRHGDLVFVFDGEPRTTTVTALLAVDEISGIVRWRIPTAGDWTSPPVVANDVLLIAAKTKLAALDLPSGRIRWVVALRGQVPPHPPAPLVIDNHVLLAQQLRGKAPPHADWVFTRHVLTTGAERGQVSIGERLMAPTFMRAVGSIVVAEGDVWVDVVDPVIPSLQSSTSFEGTFSRFVFATPRVFLGGADDRGFLVVTSDGKLRYYSVPPPDLTTPRQR